MIKILDRYLWVHILAGTLLVLLVLVSLDVFFTFMNEIGDVGRGRYGYLQALSYVLLSLPQRLYEYAPTATLIGSLLSLGSLAAHGEITAMRASSKPVSGFAASLLKIGLVIAVLVFVLGEWVSPVASQQAEILRTESLEESLSLNHQGGLWLRDDKQFVHVGKVLDQAHLGDVSVYTFSGQHLQTITHIEQAEKTTNGWQLKQLEKITIQPKQVLKTNEKQASWDRLVPSRMLDVLRISPDKMPARDLYQYVNYLEDNDLQSGQYRLAFWNRFIQPLSILVMLLLALPFVFGSQRGGGAGHRLFIGILLGIGFFLLSRMSNQLGVVYGLPALLSALATPMLFLVIALFLLRRV